MRSVAKNILLAVSLVESSPVKPAPEVPKPDVKKISPKKSDMPSAVPQNGLATPLAHACFVLSQARNSVSKITQKRG